jgi:hypothetical protein
MINKKFFSCLAYKEIPPPLPPAGRNSFGNDGGGEGKGKERGGENEKDRDG